MKTTDDVVQATFLGADDIAFKREQARKRAPKQQLPTEIPAGPCCARCRHWDRPDDLDEFGQCGFLNVIVGGPEKGFVVSQFEANQRDVPPPIEPLTTRYWFAACGGYRPAESEAAA